MCTNTVYDGKWGKLRIDFYLVHTTQVSSFPSTYFSHGRAPPLHLTSTKYTRAPFLLALELGLASGWWSRQMKSDERSWAWCSLMRYPWYSFVHPSGHVILAGIIRSRPRFETSQTAQGTSCWQSESSVLSPTSLVWYSEEYT